MKLEDPGDDHGDQCLLHLDPVTGNVAIKSILPVEHIHVRVPRTGTFVEPPGDVQILVQAVKGIPVVRVPVVSIHEIGPNKRTYGTELSYTAKELPAGEVDIVHR